MSMGENFRRNLDRMLPFLIWGVLIGAFWLLSRDDGASEKRRKAKGESCQNARAAFAKSASASFISPEIQENASLFDLQKSLSGKVCFAGRYVVVAVTETASGPTPLLWIDSNFGPFACRSFLRFEAIDLSGAQKSGLLDMLHLAVEVTSCTVQETEKGLPKIIVRGRLLKIEIATDEPLQFEELPPEETQEPPPDPRY